LRVHEYYDDTAYIADGVPGSQEIMRAREEKMKSAESIASLEKKLASLPAQIRREISYLIQDREKLSSNNKFTRSWKLIDIEPKPPSLPVASSSWIAWWRGQSSVTDWLIVLKGETVEGIWDSNPVRFDDPFRKPRVGKKPAQWLGDARRLPTVVPIDRIDRRPRDFVRIERRESIPRARTQEQRPVVSELNPEEAQKKIEEILADLTGTGEVVLE